MTRIEEAAETVRGGLRAAASVVAWLWITAAVVAVLGLGFLRWQGWSLDVVATGSMSPTVPRDSLALTSRVDPNELSIGDVVVYRGQGDSRIMHRVVEIIEHDGVLRFRTQGDLNDDPDPGLVHQDALEQQLRWSRPELGRLVTDLDRTQLVLWFMVLPLPILLIAWWPPRESEEAEPAPGHLSAREPGAPPRGASVTVHGWFIGGYVDTTMAPTRAGK